MRALIFCCGQLNSNVGVARLLPKSQVVIRRPAHLKTHPRARVSDDIATEPPTEPPPPEAEEALEAEPEDTPSLDVDEIVPLREFLRPAPIPGLIDWGIPPEATAPCDPAIDVGYPLSLWSLWFSSVVTDEAGSVPHLEARPRKSKAL